MQSRARALSEWMDPVLTFLSFFSLYLPQKTPSLIGLEFRMISTSITKATHCVETAQGVSRSLSGKVATFETRTAMNPEWDFELPIIPQYIPPNTIPKVFEYKEGANDTKRLQVKTCLSYTNPP